jgi:uncharacterized protein YndB with AHSA1/START domain
LTDRVDADRASDREIVTSRVLNARRELVFSAFSDRQRLARWWGPRGFTNTFHEFDLRPGGAWRFVMLPRRRRLSEPECVHRLGVPARGPALLAEFDSPYFAARAR